MLQFNQKPTPTNFAEIEQVSEHFLSLVVQSFCCARLGFILISVEVKAKFCEVCAESTFSYY